MLPLKVVLTVGSLVSMAGGALGFFVKVASAWGYSRLVYEASNVNDLPGFTEAFVGSLLRAAERLGLAALRAKEAGVEGADQLVGDEGAFRREVGRVMDRVEELKGPRYYRREYGFLNKRHLLLWRVNREPLLNAAHLLDRAGGEVEGAVARGDASLARRLADEMVEAAMELNRALDYVADGRSVLDYVADGASTQTLREAVYLSDPKDVPFLLKPFVKRSQEDYVSRLLPHVLRAMRGAGSTEATLEEVMSWFRRLYPRVELRNARKYVERSMDRLLRQAREVYAAVEDVVAGSKIYLLTPPSSDEEAKVLSWVAEGRPSLEALSGVQSIRGLSPLKVRFYVSKLLKEGRVRLVETPGGKRLVV